MLSKTGKYGLKAIMFLASKNESNRKFTVKELAEELDIPKYFLSKILHDLTKKDMISSQKGPGGGFYLNESQLKLNPYDYMKAIDGDGLWKYCLFESKVCELENPCIFHNTFAKFKEDLVSDLTAKTLKEY